MAAIQSVQYFDDLESARGREVEATHIGFHLGIDGKDYTIDLGDENHKQLIERMQPFIAASRRVRGAATQPTRRSSSRTSDSMLRNQTIRSWALSKGLPVSDRGRIPDEIQKAYDHEVNGVPQANGATNDDAERAQLIIEAARAAAEGARAEAEPERPEAPSDGRLFESDGRPVFETRADLNRAVRLWAKGQGEDVPERGRIPERIVNAWAERHGEPAVVQSA